ATGALTGVGGEALGPLTFTYNGAANAPVNAGSYAVVASYAGDDNYTAASASTTLDVTRATPTITVTAPSAVYDGQPHGASGTVTGIRSAVLGPLAFTYNGAADPPVN